MLARATVLFAIAIFVSSVAGPAAAGRRAFVVGIDSYPNLDARRQLGRAVSDARSIADALKGLGFNVTLKLNTPQSDFFYEFDAFNQAVQEEDVVALYFSGHGVQMGGLNYLLPSDAPAPGRAVEEFLKGRSIQLNALIDQLGTNKPSIRLVIVDACRDNPYQISGRGIGAPRGLANVAKVKGTFLMFSADAGQTALDMLPPPLIDGDRNSPYTRKLISLLREPGRTLPDMARKLRREVEELVAAVPHEQSPAYYDGLSGDFCLGGECRTHEDLRRELEQRRQEEARQTEELRKLRAETASALERIEAAERAAREARKEADIAQAAIRDAETRGRVELASRTATPSEKDLAPKAEPEVKAAREERMAVTRDIQGALTRLGCYDDQIDGVWGEKTRSSLQRFSQITKLTIPTDAPTATAAAALESRQEQVCIPSTARAVTPSDSKPAAPKKPARPNPLKYSGSVWPSGTIPTGSTRSTSTPYGTLVCQGGSLSGGVKRECWWN